MKHHLTPLPGVIVIEPKLIGDHRGSFFEAYRENQFSELGLPHFVQDNQSLSIQGTLRGLHFQAEPQPQAKLVRVLKGTIFDVAVDIRPDSPTFKQWYGTYLTSENNHMLFVPTGFAHGFYVLSETAEVLYKCSDYYAAELDRAIAWNDSSIGVKWPLIDNQAPLISKKDAEAPTLG
ncbi:MAG: dTDP-4-dehydrorhamnose 3,5-epimerase [Candidatus Margulisiibacteriota bacterium]